MPLTASSNSAWRDSANPLAPPAKAQLDAMGKLARIGADTMRQVMQQQQDLFLTAMGRWRDAAGNTPKDPAALLGLPLEAARFSTEIALRNASELVEIARHAQSEMLAVLTQRAEDATVEVANAVEAGATDTGMLARETLDEGVAATDSAVTNATEAAQTAVDQATATFDQIADAGKLVE